VNDFLGEIEGVGGVHDEVHVHCMRSCRSVGLFIFFADSKGCWSRLPGDAKRPPTIFIYLACQNDQSGCLLEVRFGASFWVGMLSCPTHSKLVATPPQGLKLPEATL
jgi:hypothetical protein